MDFFFSRAQALGKRVTTNPFVQKRRKVTDLKPPAQRLPGIQQSSLAALLPAEVLLLIFTYIPVSEISIWRNRTLHGITSAAPAALTCRSWTYEATTALYTHILLIGFPSAVLFYRTIQVNPRLGNLVKTMDMPVLSEPWRPPSLLKARMQKRWLKDMRWPGRSAVLITLLELCPNVTDLSFALMLFEASPDPFVFWTKSPKTQDAAIRQFTHLRLLHPYATGLAHILIDQGGLQAMPALRTLELHMYADTWHERRLHEGHCLASTCDGARDVDNGSFHFVLGGLRPASLGHAVYLRLLSCLSLRIDSLVLLRCSFPTTIEDTIISSLHLEAPISGFPRLKQLTISGYPPFRLYFIPSHDFVSSLLAPTTSPENDRTLLAAPIRHLTLIDQILLHETIDLFIPTVESLFLKLTVDPDYETTSLYTSLLSPLFHIALARTLRTLVIDWRFPINDDVLSAWKCTLPGLLGLETLVLGQIPTGLLASDPSSHYSAAFPISTSATESGLKPLLPPPTLSLPPNIRSLRLNCFPYDQPSTIPVGRLQIIKLLFPSIDDPSLGSASRYSDLKDVEILAPHQLMVGKHVYWKGEIITWLVRETCRKSGINIRAISVTE